MPRFPSDLERERGSSAPNISTPVSVNFGSQFIEQYEHVPDLCWPSSVTVYDVMRRSSPSIGAILRAIRLPILGTTWALEGDDVDPRVMDLVEYELGLTPPGEGRKGRRRRVGISWVEVLRDALSSLWAGHSFAEQVYAIGPPPTILADAGLPPSLAHLRKVAWRPPRSLASIDVARDGGLAGIRQYVPMPTGRVETVTIPVDRLVAFVNEREGADWSGVSLLRTAYPPWLVTDFLKRIGPMVVERNGMGVPVIEYPPEGTERKALDLVRRYRAGDEAGLAMPEGYKFSLQGVVGSTRDELPLLKYHEEAISRSALAMLLDLGHDAGARSLGDTFAAFFSMSLNAITAAIEEVATEHVIADLVRLNFGEDEAYPELRAEELSAESVLTAEALGKLIAAGVITVDNALESDVRRRFGLPRDFPGTAQGPAPAPGFPTEIRPVPPSPPAGLPPGSPGPGGLPVDGNGRARRPAPAASLSDLEARLAAAQDAYDARARYAARR